MPIPPQVANSNQSFTKILLYKLLPIILIIVLAYPGLRDLMKPGHFTSHDGEGHVIRMQEFYRAFKDGQFPVRWSQRLYYGYGYPFFNFNYPSVYYLGLPTMLLGGSATLAMEMEFGATFVLSGILMYLYLKRKISTPFAFLGGVLYMYAPYRLLNIYVRGSVAESATFIFAPLILWTVEAIAHKKKFSIPLGALMIGFLGISHNIAALLLFAFYWGYSLLFSISKKSIKALWRFGLTFGFGLMLAAFFLVPALTEKSLTFLDTTIAKDYPDHFIDPVQLVNSGWDYGASIKGPDDGLSFNLGWVHLGLAILSIFIMIMTVRNLKNKKLKLTFFYNLFVLLMSLFFMFKISLPLWDNLPLLPFVQFSWRFIMLAVPTMSIMAVIGLHLIGKEFKWSSWVKVSITTILIGLTLFFARDKWYLNQPLFWENPVGQSIPGSTTWAHEQATQWFTPKPTEIPGQRVETLADEGEATINLWKTHLHHYQVKVSQPTTVIEHTMYYPGWQVWIDGQQATIDYQHEQHPGKIVFQVPAGSHEVITKMTETPIRKAVDIISVLTLAGMLGWIGYLIIFDKKD